MGWFEDQIKERNEADENAINDAFSGIAGAVVGKSEAMSSPETETDMANPIKQILDCYHIASENVPAAEDIDKVLEYFTRSYGIMHRRVRLEKGWYKDASGPMLATLRRGDIVALLPTLYGSYRFYDVQKKKYITLGRKTEDLLKPDAIALYKPFPRERMTFSALFAYIWEQIRLVDVVILCTVMLIITLIGMLLPRITELMLSDVLHSGSVSVLIGAGIYMAGVSVSSLMFGAFRMLATSRINTRLSVNIEAAAIMRMLSMPASFFRDYSSGELSSRLGHIKTLSDQFVALVFGSSLASLFSLMYIFQIFRYAPGLVVPSLLITGTTLAITVAAVSLRARVIKQQMVLSSKENGISYALISGIQKIRLTGAENRAFGKWGKAYANQASLTYNPPLFLKVSGVLITAVSLLGTIVIYFFAIKTHVSPADYYAFNVSFGMVSMAFTALAQTVTSISEIKPTLEIVRPFFDNEPEMASEQEEVADLTGEIEINGVTFGYDEDAPPILNDLSFKVSPGQYVAIVGKTGCGKSTLVRLLLGFETPQKGSVCYDGKDLRRLDKKSLRRKIGTVMQDGRLFAGDIYSNIVISAPHLSQKDAWAAAELAGIADDIRNMPMGMNTFICEGQGGISGGQKQRLMIARAVAPKPKILIFDEATSALDNITQKNVSEALDAMNCTRVIIAHRLSTIRHCDRIIVLDGGRIAEDGTYEELMEKNGFFADLVSRQKLESY
ncbi:MAG: ATP-binding cassette domain-containing protein [Lachnospiraceae bacterium]|nr:ATP-binding cassette domain-containing protein [Lachnospiraceae bacterium]